MLDGSDGRNEKNEGKHACQNEENKTRVHFKPQFTCPDVHYGSRIHSSQSTTFAREWFA
jgi:hypothetical protein